ncbi:FMRFamide receptor-like [Biomphalaria glabrata]|uniref:FMRFamide receptor-like n=1 Tax=Biomphalaria glabrata TaxID=6526 RepID=A0A9W3AN29_BIOGL|nr:FMRFamide receptor-like [Biomphalaria glabrata]
MNNNSGVELTIDLTQSDSANNFDVRDEVYTLMVIVTMVIIANILSLVGTIGSILNIIILSHHKMQDTTNVVLLAISVCDLIYSITQISFNFSQSAFLINVYIFMWVYVIHTLIFDTINYFAAIVSIHLVTLVSIERMVAVCFPFHVSRIFTLSRIKVIIVAIVCCNLVLRIPALFKYEMQYFEYMNATLPGLKYGDFYYQNVYFFNTFSTLAAHFLFTILPFLAISICTSLSIFHISITSKTKATLSSIEAIAKRKKEMKSVKIVLIICVLIMFLVLIPLIVQQVIYSFNLVRIPLKWSIIAFWLVNLLTQINSSFNFLIYVTSSPKFKSTLMTCFTFKKRVKH